jgi:copper chaperone CopZ
MHSGNCARAVEHRLRELPGIVAVRVKYPPGFASITFENEIDTGELQDALKAGGYTLKVVAQD